MFDFKNYYAVKYQHSHLDALVARHPDKAETFSIGQSYEGRDMKVGGFAIPENCFIPDWVDFQDIIDYRSVAQILEQMSQYVHVQVIRISNDLANADSKPMIWVDGGIHAREWISSHTVLYIANALLSEVDTGLRSQVTK